MQRAANVEPHGAGEGWTRGRSGAGGRPPLRSGRTLVTVLLAVAGAAGLGLCLAASPRASATRPRAAAGQPAPAERDSLAAAAATDGERTTSLVENPAPDTALPPFERYRPL